MEVMVSNLFGILKNDVSFYVMDFIHNYSV
jgi:hypothetical protein